MDIGETGAKSTVSSKASNNTKRPEVVVITGASAGVGRATAQAFARCGAHIALLARGRAGWGARHNAG